MSVDLMEAFRSASSKAKHRAGALTLVCLDDESLDQSEYGHLGGRTIVPRSREEGGIEGLPLGNDCKYGEGVTRRHLVDDGHGGFKVESQEENYRPDKAFEKQQDLFSDETLKDVGVEVIQDDPLVLLRKQAQAALAGAEPDPVGVERPADGNGQMMQMMSTMLQIVAQQKAPAVDEPAVEPAKADGKDVKFSGDFGRITVRYADVIVRNEFIVLVSRPNQATTYEPPLSTDQRPIRLEVDGDSFLVMNLDLSFTHKGDILLLMPLTLNPDDANAEETE